MPQTGNGALVAEGCTSWVAVHVTRTEDVLHNAHRRQIFRSQHSSHRKLPSLVDGFWRSPWLLASLACHQSRPKPRRQVCPPPCAGRCCDWQRQPRSTESTGSTRAEQTPARTNSSTGSMLSSLHVVQVAWAKTCLSPPPFLRGPYRSWQLSERANCRGREGGRGPWGPMAGTLCETELLGTGCPLSTPVAPRTFKKRAGASTSTQTSNGH